MNSGLNNVKSFAKPEDRNTAAAKQEVPTGTKSAKVIRIPTLYANPAGGRELQGCMKARA